MHRVIILGDCSGLGSALIAQLMATGIAGEVQLVTERDIATDRFAITVEEFNRLVISAPDLVDLPPIATHPQVTYTGPLRKGKKGKFKRW